MKKLMISLLVLLFLFFISIITTIKYVKFGSIPETPANDLGKHLATALNFKDAILDGQYLPRLQLSPKDFPDLPTFQYYGSLSSLSAFPFLLIRLSPLTSLMLGILSLRWIAEVFIYKMGRLLGASRYVAILASASYLLTPYIISNLYGRVAIPEAAAHCVLAFFFYGFVRLYLLRDRLGFASIVIAIVCLSLAHPTFLLYSIAFSLLISVAIRDFRFLKCVVLAIICGMFCCCFQWLPGLLFFHDLKTGFTSASPYGVKDYTSASGLYWFPRALKVPFDNNTSRLYFTPGILTVPALVWAFRIRRIPFAGGLVIALAVALFLSFSPINVWAVIPKTFWAVQFPYRIIAFVAIFTSMAICVSFNRIGNITCILLLILVAIQSGSLILQIPYGGMLPGGLTEGQIKENYSIIDYISKSNRTMLPATSSDGWLVDNSDSLYGDNSVPNTIVNERGGLRDKNVFILKENNFPENYIKISGSFSDFTNNSNHSIWVADPEVPNKPISKIVTLGEGTFSTTVEVPSNGRAMSLRCGLNEGGRVQDLGEQYCSGLHIKDIQDYPRNVFYATSNSDTGTQLIFDGRTIFPEESMDMWIAKPESPSIPVSKKITLGPGSFHAQFTLPKGPGAYVLVTSKFYVPAKKSPGSSDWRRLSVSIDSMRLVNRYGVSSFNPKASNIREVYRRGYVRKFAIGDLGDVDRDAIERNGVLLDLPMAYSRFIEIRQAGIVIPSYATGQGLISVFTKNTSSEIVAEFKFPRFSIVITCLGWIFLICFFITNRKSTISVFGRDV